FRYGGGRGRGDERNDGVVSLRGERRGGRSYFVGGEPAEGDDDEAAAEGFGGGAGGGRVGGGGGVDVVGQALHDGLAPGARGDVAGGGVHAVAVGADGEGVGARGEGGAEGGKEVGLENIAGKTGEGGGTDIVEVGEGDVPDIGR